MTTHTRTITSIIAEGTSNAAGATTRGVVDVRGADMIKVHVRITNGASAPTIQAEGRILFADTDGATPGAAADGAAWKTEVSGITPGTVASAVRNYVAYFPGGQTHIEVEVTGNTGQAVTCEATCVATVFS